MKGGKNSPRLGGTLHLGSMSDETIKEYNYAHIVQVCLTLVFFHKYFVYHRSV